MDGRQKAQPQQPLDQHNWSRGFFCSHEPLDKGEQLMGNFGWSLPAGCDRTPGEEDVFIHPLSEELSGKLEDAGIPDGRRDDLVRALDEAIAAIYEELRGPEPRERD